jgi:hypothetical protein
MRSVAVFSASGEGIPNGSSSGRSLIMARSNGNDL